MPFSDDLTDGEVAPGDRGCSCCLHGQHGTAAATPPEEELWQGAVEDAVLRAVFPSDVQRRVFLKAVGKATALAAISELLPIAAATEAFADHDPVENPNLTLAFIPITCATPLVLAAPMGVYVKYGLRVQLVKAPSFADIREKVLKGEYHAAHMLAPMPIAMTLGLGSPAVPFTMPALENVNGSAITLAVKHKDKRDPRAWKGLTFALPFPYSIHNYLLRYYLAEHGLDPDKDVNLKLVPPAQMIGQLKEGLIDGFVVAEPFNQRAVYDGVGFIHILSKEIWNRHPCCALVFPQKFITGQPNAARAVLKSLIEATAFAANYANRKLVAEFISSQNYLNQPLEVIEQVLTGRFKDGTGNERNVPDRIDFDPFPWHSFAVWILTQMKRWGQIKGDVDYAAIAQQVYLTTGAVEIMRENGFAPPKNTFKKFYVMSKEFDPAKPDEYIASFPIKRPA